MALDYTKPSNQLLADLINESNKTSFALDKLRFGTPEVLGEEVRERNTKIVVEIKSPTMNWRKRTLYYDRLDLTDTLGAEDMAFTDDVAYVNYADLLPLINARHGLGLTADDIIDGPIVRSAGEPAEVTLTANPGSLVYIGEVVLTLADAAV